MQNPAFIADLLALVHGAYVGFVLGGQLLILAGWWVGWEWTRNPGFRWLHLGAIGIAACRTWGIVARRVGIEARFSIVRGE
jgi:hypothetical protein